MIWGAAGCGKTLLASTAPGKKLWLLFDPNGADTLNISPERDNCTVVDLSKQACNIIAQGCVENPFGIEQYLKDNTFDTVVMTELSFSCVSFGGECEKPEELKSKLLERIEY